jgi:hypothetical protein
MDERGFLRIEGRAKDMIIRGGENIYPREIENVLFTHPQVADVAVVGVPDEHWGEIVAAFIRPRGVEPTEEDLRAHCRQHLAPYKTPQQWVFVDSFPLTPSGKVQKYKLREGLRRSQQLQRELVGTWRLESFHVLDSRGAMSHPYGRDAIGYYLFSASGYMSMVIMAPDRACFTGGDLLRGTTDEKAKAAGTYISYTGRYHVKDDTLFVHPQAAFFPNWIGVEQARTMRFTSTDELELSTPPMLLAGRQQTAHLVWKRI